MLIKQLCISYEIGVLNAIYLIFNIGDSLIDTAIRPYILRTACREKYKNENHDCSSNLDEFAMYLVWYKIITNVPSILIGILCGAYSDIYGRKIPMIIPNIGYIVSVLFILIGKYYSRYEIELTFMGAFIQGLCGRNAVFGNAMSSHITDITDVEQRTPCMEKLLAMNFFGIFFGALLSGFLQDFTTIEITFCSAEILFFIITLLIIYFIKEDSIPLTTEASVIRQMCLVCTNSKKNPIDDSSKQIKKRSNRTLAIVVFSISFVIQMCRFGELEINALYVSRSPLSWPASWYGYLVSEESAVSGFYLFFILPIITGLFSLTDFSVTVSSMVFKIIRLSWAVYQTESWMVFSSIVISSFSAPKISSLRSIFSKLFDNDEIGTMFSLLSLVEGCAKWFGPLVFTAIYNYTYTILPGFSYLAQDVCYVIILIVFICVFCTVKTDDKIDTKVADK